MSGTAWTREYEDGVLYHVDSCWIPARCVSVLDLEVSPIIPMFSIAVTADYPVSREPSECMACHSVSNA